MRLKDAVTDFIGDRAAYCSGETIEYYEDGLRMFLRWAAESGKEDLEQLENRDIILYQTYLREKKGQNKSGKLKNTSVNTYMRSVRTFLKWLHAESLLQELPRMPKRLRDDADQIFVLTTGEVNDADQLIFVNAEAANISDELSYILYLRNYLIFHLMLDEALRIGEVIRMRRSDLDFDKRIIYVNKGKGMKDRIVPLAEKLISKFRMLFECYPGECRHSDILFYSYNLRSQISVDTVKQFFGKLKRNKGLERLHPHILRHTFATSFIMSGGDISVLKVLLGHSDILITQRYLHLAAQFSISRLDIYQLDPIFYTGRRHPDS